MPILREKGLADNFEVYIDGGVRRATDILKAVCLGAKGVGIGRPFYMQCQDMEMLVSIKLYNYLKMK